MADGSAGGAILGLVEDAAEQLQELIRKSSAQLRNFVDKSLAKIDARQKEAEAKLEAATKAAEERARAAADEALAKVLAEMDALRAEMQKHKDEIDSVRGLSGKRLNIADAVGGFDFDGDGEADDDGQEYFEDERERSEAPPVLAAEARPSAEDLEAIAQRVFDRLHGLIQNGTLTLQAAQTRDDSVHLVTDPDFLDFVRTGTRGDVVSFELTPIAFNLIAVLDLLMAGQDAEAGALLDKLLAHDTESFKDYCDAKVEKRMEAVG